MKRLALTFDDGPSRWTPAVVDLLGEHGARATFFLIGQRVRERPHDVRRIVEAGHEIGSHTMTHPRLTEIGDDEARREIQDGRAPSPRSSVSGRLCSALRAFTPTNAFADRGRAEARPDLRGRRSPGLAAGRGLARILSVVLAGCRAGAIVDLTTATLRRRPVRVTTARRRWRRFTTSWRYAPRLRVRDR